MASSSGKSLVIVESPAKARTINKYLGAGYVVRASMGHVRDLPRSGMGVDLTTFRPTYEVIRGRAKVLNELKKLARRAEAVYLATDLDREGEAIAWHLKEALGIPDQKARRVVFNAITRSAIQQAFNHPQRIDQDKVNAQQARRIMDRIVGYEISPLLWRKVAQGLSAGRVQSVAVRMVVDREREIEAFEPQEYWKISAVFATRDSGLEQLRAQWQQFTAAGDRGEPSRAQKSKWLSEHQAFEADLVEFAGAKFQAGNADQALHVAELLGFQLQERQAREVPEGKGPAAHQVLLRGQVGPPHTCPPCQVQSVERKRMVSRPPAPFITSTLQQAASTRLGLSASRTMRIAQSLYEAGYITYMRTDSTNLAPEAVRMVRDYVAARFGDRYLPQRPNRFASRKSAQEAHEAIRPTDVNLDPKAARSSLPEADCRLYRLIWERFVACQMRPAEFDATTVLIACQTSEGAARFRAAGRRLVFDGFMKVAGISNGDQLLPELAERQRVYPLELSPTQNFTQPPPRYTEASLVKALEAEGIGRPSTYATIIQTIQDRGYVEQINRRFHATLLGKVVTDKLVQGFPQIMDLRFTADMENKLDAIEEQHLDWVKLLQDFYGPFHGHVEQALRELDHAGGMSSPYSCDDCGRPMVYRISRNGFFLACSGYPKCKARKAVDRQGKPLVREQTEHPCPSCGKPMIKQVGRFGPFLGCSGYPDCKTIVNIDRAGKVLPPKPKPLTTELTCSKCGRPLYLRRGKRGPWLGCSGFPRCRARASFAALPAEQKQKLLQALDDSAAHQPGTPTDPTSTGQAAQRTNVTCQQCGNPMVIRYGKRGPFLGCSSFPNCRHSQPLTATLQEQLTA